MELALRPRIMPGGLTWPPHEPQRTLLTEFREVQNGPVRRFLPPFSTTTFLIIPRPSQLISRMPKAAKSDTEGETVKKTAPKKSDLS
jgi:hypothetical protein